MKNLLKLTLTVLILTNSTFSFGGKKSLGRPQIKEIKNNVKIYAERIKQLNTSTDGIGNNLFEKIKSACNHIVSKYSNYHNPYEKFFKDPFGQYLNLNPQFSEEFKNYFAEIRRRYLRYCNEDENKPIQTLAKNETIGIGQYMKLKQAMPAHPPLLPAPPAPAMDDLDQQVNEVVQQIRQEEAREQEQERLDGLLEGLNQELAQANNNKIQEAERRRRLKEQRIRREQEYNEALNRHNGRQQPAPPAPDIAELNQQLNEERELRAREAEQISQEKQVEHKTPVNQRTNKQKLFFNDSRNFKRNDERFSIEKKLNNYAAKENEISQELETPQGKIKNPTSANNAEKIRKKAIKYGACLVERKLKFILNKTKAKGSLSEEEKSQLEKAREKISFCLNKIEKLKTDIEKLKIIETDNTNTIARQAKEINTLRQNLLIVIRENQSQQKTIEVYSELITSHNETDRYTLNSDYESSDEESSEEEPTLTDDQHEELNKFDSESNEFFTTWEWNEEQHNDLAKIVNKIFALVNNTNGNQDIEIELLRKAKIEILKNEKNNKKNNENLSETLKALLNNVENFNKNNVVLLKIARTCANKKVNGGRGKETANNEVQEDTPKYYDFNDLGLNSQIKTLAEQYFDTFRHYNKKYQDFDRFWGVIGKYTKKKNWDSIWGPQLNNSLNSLLRSIIAGIDGKTTRGLSLDNSKKDFAKIALIEKYASSQQKEKTLDKASKWLKEQIEPLNNIFAQFNTLQKQPGVPFGDEIIHTIEKLYSLCCEHGDTNFEAIKHNNSEEDNGNEVTFEEPEEENNKASSEVKKKEFNNSEEKVDAFEEEDSTTDYNDDYEEENFTDDEEEKANNEDISHLLASIAGPLLGVDAIIEKSKEEEWENILAWDDALDKQFKDFCDNVIQEKFNRTYLYRSKSFNNLESSQKLENKQAAKLLFVKYVVDKCTKKNGRNNIKKYNVKVKSDLLKRISDELLNILQTSDKDSIDLLTLYTDLVGILDRVSEEEFDINSVDRKLLRNDKQLSNSNYNELPKVEKIIFHELGTVFSPYKRKTKLNGNRKGNRNYSRKKSSKTAVKSKWLILLRPGSFSQFGSPLVKKLGLTIKPCDFTAIKLLYDNLQYIKIENNSNPNSTKRSNVNHKGRSASRRMAKTKKFDKKAYLEQYINYYCSCWCDQNNSDLVAYVNKQYKNAPNISLLNFSLVKLMVTQYLLVENFNPNPKPEEKNEFRAKINTTLSILNNKTRRLLNTNNAIKALHNEIYKKLNPQTSSSGVNEKKLQEGLNHLLEANGLGEEDVNKYQGDIPTLNKDTDNISNNKTPKNNTKSKKRLTPEEKSQRDKLEKKLKEKLERLKKKKKKRRKKNKKGENNLEDWQVNFKNLLKEEESPKNKKKKTPKNKKRNNKK